MSADEYTGLLLRRAQQAHVLVWQDTVSADVSSVQFGVLDAIDRQPGSSQRDVGDRLDLDRSTIADLVARLERRGVIRRERDAADRRRNVLALTDAGLGELAELRPRVARMDAVLTASLDPTALHALRDALELLVNDPAIRALAAERRLPTRTTV